MATVVLVLVAALAAIVGVFVVGMRRKSRAVTATVIWFSRKVINPSQLRSAGSPGSDASIVRHVGRSSGRAYETPVDVVPLGDDTFLIALPYGRRTSWLRNVLAAGSATIVHDGRTVAVNRPEVLPMRDVVQHFPAGDRRGFRLLRTDECLRLRLDAAR